jgi:hypothetical protein
MTDVDAALSGLSPGEIVSLIVKPLGRPDDRDDHDVAAVKIDPPYLFDDGESLYTIRRREGVFRVTVDGLDCGELRSIVR